MYVATSSDTFENEGLGDIQSRPASLSEGCRVQFASLHVPCKVVQTGKRLCNVVHGNARRRGGFESSQGHGEVQGQLDGSCHDVAHLVHGIQANSRVLGRSVPCGVTSTSHRSTKAYERLAENSEVFRMLRIQGCRWIRSNQITCLRQKSNLMPTSRWRTIVICIVRQQLIMQSVRHGL